MMLEAIGSKVPQSHLKESGVSLLHWEAMEDF